MARAKLADMGHNLDSEWRTMQHTADQKQAALQAQITLVERLRRELMTEIHKLEAMLAHGR